MIFLYEKIYMTYVYITIIITWYLTIPLFRTRCNFHISSEFINRNSIRMKNVHCFELIYNAVILDGCLWNLKDWISVKDVIKF